MGTLKPCPICGGKAYVMHDVADGFEFGWSAGCARFCICDVIHDMDETTPEADLPRVMYCNTKTAAIEAWNRKADSIKARREADERCNQ